MGIVEINICQEAQIELGDLGEHFFLYLFPGRPWWTWSSRLICRRSHWLNTGTRKCPRIYAHMTSDGKKKRSRNKTSNQKYSLRKINRSRCAKFVNCERMTFHPPTLLDIGPGVGVCGVGGKKLLHVLKISAKSSPVISKCCTTGQCWPMMESVWLSQTPWRTTYLEIESVLFRVVIVGDN